MTINHQTILSPGLFTIIATLVGLLLLLWLIVNTVWAIGEALEWFDDRRATREGTGMKASRPGLLFGHFFWPHRKLYVDIGGMSDEASSFYTGRIGLRKVQIVRCGMLSGWYPKSELRRRMEPGPTSRWTY